MLPSPDAVPGCPTPSSAVLPLCSRKLFTSNTEKQGRACRCGLRRRASKGRLHHFPAVRLGFWGWISFTALGIILCDAFSVSQLDNWTPGRQDVVHPVISSHLSSHSFLYTITLLGPKNRDEHDTLWHVVGITNCSFFFFFLFFSPLCPMIQISS